MLSSMRFVLMAAVAAAPVIAYLFGLNQGAENERARAIAAALERINERGDINEEVRELGDCDLLRELTDSLPDDCIE